MNISPKDVYWCMVKVPRLLELAAWVHIDASALQADNSSDLQTGVQCKITHLTLRFWIHALFLESQSILFKLIGIPTHLQSLILYDMSFYRYVPLCPLVNAIAGSMKTLQHFELQQHLDGRIVLTDQFGPTSFVDFPALDTLVLPCMYESGPLDLYFRPKLPGQLQCLRLCSPAMLSWTELRELILHKPAALKTIVADVGLGAGVLSDLLSRHFPSVCATVRAPFSRRNPFVDAASVSLYFTKT